MSWVTPKTDWAVDVVDSSDFNRIEENIRVLHNISETSVTASSENVTLPFSDEKKYFTLTSVGSVLIKRIDGTDWVNGSIVYLVLNDTTRIFYNTKEVNDGSFLPIAQFANSSIDVHGYFPLSALTGAIAMLMKQTDFWVLMNQYYV